MFWPYPVIGLAPPYCTVAEFTRTTSRENMLCHTLYVDNINKTIHKLFVLLPIQTFDLCVPQLQGPCNACFTDTIQLPLMTCIYTSRPPLLTGTPFFVTRMSLTFHISRTLENNSIHMNINQRQKELFQADGKKCAIYMENAIIKNLTQRHYRE